MAKLAAEVEPVSMFRLGDTQKYFEGTLTADRFYVQRIIYNDAGFLLHLCGAIEPEATGAVVRIKMQLPSSTKTSRSLMMLGATIIFILTLVQAPHWIATAQAPLWVAMPLFAIVPLASLVFAWAVPQTTREEFGEEARQQKEKLLEIFGGSALSDG